MTWQNLLFVIAGVALMFLIEWGRHHIEQWPTERKWKAAMVIALIVLVVAGIFVVWAAFGGPPKKDN